MEAMLGETGGGSREEGGNSSCDTGGTCVNGELNGDLEDTMEMCDVSQHNSLMLKVVSSKCLTDECSSSIAESSQVASDGSGNIEHPQDLCFKKSDTSDKVPNSEPANMCRDLASEVPTSFGKIIEHIDIEQTVDIPEIIPVSTHSVKDSELSKEIVDFNKNCDDVINHAGSAHEENVVNEVLRVIDKNIAGLYESSELKSQNDEICIPGVSGKSIVHKINDDCSDKESDNCQKSLQKSDSSMNDVGACDSENDGVRKVEIETHGKIDGGDERDVKNEQTDIDEQMFEYGREERTQIATKSGSIEQSNKDIKDDFECHISSTVCEEKDEKIEEQVQNSTQNSESKSEEVSSKAKKSRKSAFVLNLTPRRSSRNLNKQKSYVEKEEEPEIQEIAPSDPLADPLSTDSLRDDKENSKTRNARKNTIVVNDTKRLVEIATGSKGVKGGKKEPTLVIIDTNSILSGRGPVPVSQGSPPGPSSSSSSGYSVLPIALPAQSLYPPIHLNNPAPSTPLHPSAQVPVQPRPSPPQILPTLTDDMYVVEAPSFIVPYVYEKPPIKPLKEYLEQLELEIEETKHKEAIGSEEEKATVDSLQENESSENEESKNQIDGDADDVDDGDDDDDNNDNDDSDSGKVNGEKSEAPASSSKKVDQIENGDKNAVIIGTVSDSYSISKSKAIATGAKEESCEKNSTAPESTACESVKGVEEDKSVYVEKTGDFEKCDGNEKAVVPEKGIGSERADDTEKGDSEKRVDHEKGVDYDKGVDTEKGVDCEKQVDAERSSDIEKSGENVNPENNGNAVSVDGRERNEVKLDDTGKSSYFLNPLGKFFMQIGINLVQEYVQTDLLRSQKRKRDREGRKGTVSTQFAINSLVKNLEFSKENNEPFHLEQKKCEYCSFKTESSLVMAQHLETPHMRNYVYRCNFCPLEVRSPHDILFHMEAEHNVRGRLERAPAFHQCPNCPFEDSQKGKLTRHLLSCSKKHKPERNQEPPSDWEPPAKIPRLARSRPTALGLGAAAYQAMAAKSVHPLLPKLVPGTVLPPAPVGLSRGRGRPPIHGRYIPQDTKAVQRPIAPTQARQSMMYRPSGTPGQPQVLLPTAYQIGSQIYQVVGSQSQMPMVPSSVSPVPRLALMSPSTADTTVTTPVALVPSVATVNSSITIQSATKSPTAKLLQQPSISITPLPRQPAGMAPGGTLHPKYVGHSGHPGHSPNKATFVICEICDGYIKDLEQLRNHMQWIHKVKIHPKMIYNRPPLNCQKCQFRFFTDQGLERHLLGSHGLVTSSMQEAANKGKDGGRCPVCGRVYQWKLLNHVARDHNMSLKPAHLSYKCTVCTATFGMYKQFENHVYSAHSVVAKRVIDKKGPQVTRPQSSETLLKPLKINDEITIIPQPARPRPGPASRTGAVSAIMQQNMGPKRFKQRLQQKQSSVQVIELEDSPVKKDKATDGSSFQENGEDTLNAVKERLRRRKSLEISQVDSECSSHLSEDAPVKKRRRNDE